MSNVGVGRHILYYQDKYGKDLIDYVASNGMSTSAIQWAEKVCKYLGWDEDQTFTVVKWMVKHEAVRKARFALEERISKDAFADAILNDKELMTITDAVQTPA